MKVFISHSSTDKKFVRTLKDDLHENAIETWFDEDELDLGDLLADKLELALEQSSHFLIILSAASVNSEWVKFELKKALKQKDTELLQKIIPVKYNECEVPKELEDLIYQDLSKEIRQIKDNKVVFVSDGYLNFLNRLCRAIRNSEKQLTKSDKSAIKKEVDEKSINETSLKNTFIKSSYKLIGYKDSDSRLIYSKAILTDTKDESLKNVQEIRPVLLPPLLKFSLKGLKLGDEISFSKNYFFNEYGHFAGFRKDDLAITLDSRIRKGLNLTNGVRYYVEIDPKKRNINFIET
jgi:TIR domain